MKIDPSAPAYPLLSNTLIVGNRGLPIRLELAARMMAGNMGNPECSGELSVFADYALKAADALIAAYNEGEK